VLHPDIRARAEAPEHADGGRRDPEARLAEAVGLAGAIGLEVVEAGVVRVGRLRPASLLGLGAVETYAEVVAQQEILVAIIDAPLSPVQQRNLEQAWKCKVIDRTGLILEIFGARARTREGQLQVELAALQYQRSRLVRSWTHLERQRGGFGFLGGPGESQLEMDRRLITERIIRIKADLGQVVRTRELHRGARRRVPYPVVALVGYTNAGKSTLFNRLTRAEVLAEDQLFATLDPTMRRLALPGGTRAILSDTVGFISDLPTGLVAAFRATLEEVVEADLILHVRDIAHPDSEAQRDDVHAVLRSLGLEERLDGGHLEVLNKIDLLSPNAREFLITRARGDDSRVAVSAVSGEGIAALLGLIEDRLTRARRAVDLALDPADGAALAWLYERGRVVERRDLDEAVVLRVELEPADRARFERRHGASLRPLPAPVEPARTSTH